MKVAMVKVCRSAAVKISRFTAHNFELDGWGIR